MRTILFSLLFGLMSFHAAVAQSVADSASRSQSHGFDPVVFLSTLRINQYFGEGKVRIPQGMRVTLVDSAFSNDICVYFSMRLEPDSAEGWTTWLDFDADRYYRPRLSRIFAQRRLPEGQEDAFQKYRAWVEVVQKSNLGEATVREDAIVSWPWLTHTAYTLTIRRIEEQGAHWLTLSLAHDRGAASP
jgi:hypothetical protein